MNMNITIIEQFKGHKLIRDATFPESVIYCVLGSSDVVLTEDSDKDRVINFWNLFKGSYRYQGVSVGVNS